MAKISLLEKNYNEVVSGLDKLYSWLHILKGYTKVESVRSEEVANIDSLLVIIIKEIDTLISYI